MHEDFETYRWDGHTALSTIMGLRADACHDLLLQLLEDAPNCLARALAIEHPLDVDKVDAVERFVQDGLPIA